MDRRNFIKNTAAIAALTAVGIDQAACTDSRKAMKPLRVTATDSNFEREPLIRPFGFKGNFLRELWQTAAMLQGESGARKTGICTQSV
jgi:hypothetical protein